MATIEIADNDARVQYTQAVTANTTQLTIDFPFFDLDDINVIVTTAAGVDSTLSRGTGTGTFAVTGTSVDDGFSGGYVTLGDSYSAGTDTFTILRDIPVARTTDFPTSGPFNISSLNTELDKIIAIEQELETKVSRTMKLADSDSAASITLPSSATRANKFLSFDANGAVTVSTTIGDYKGTDATTTTAAYVKHDIIKSTTAAQLNNIYICIVDSAIGDLLTDTTHFELIVDAVSASTSATNAATSATAAANSATQATTNGAAQVTLATAQVALATTQATNAASSATDAQGSEDEAEAWAQKTNGEAVTGQGYSSKAWATGGTGVSDTAGSGASKEWAVEQSGTVDGTEYSAKEYAIGSQAGNSSGSAKQWALGGGASYATNTTVDGSNYSAKYWAEQAAASADSVDDIYLGAKSSAPTLDNDGNALQTGALYFNNSSDELYVWNGTSWQVTAVTASGFATAGFSIAMSIAL